MIGLEGTTDSHEILGPDVSYHIGALDILAESRIDKHGNTVWLEIGRVTFFMKDRQAIHTLLSSILANDLEDNGPLP